MRREDLKDVPTFWLREELLRRERDEKVRELLEQAPNSVLAQIVKYAEGKRA